MRYVRGKTARLGKKSWQFWNQKRIRLVHALFPFSFYNLGLLT